MPKPAFEGQTLIASEVDERTHAELLCMYQDSEQNIRFSKLIQWRMTAAALAIFVLFALLAQSYSTNGNMTKILVIFTCLVWAISICILIIFQMWQGTERGKIQLITSRLSSLAREVHNRKLKLAADIERYMLLSFMCCAVFTGGFLTLSRLMGWFSG